MAYCHLCGVALPAAARFCSACGGAQSAQPALAATPAGAQPPGSKDTRLPQLLLLIGGLVGIVWPLLWGLFMVAVGAAFMSLPGWPFGAVWGWGGFLVVAAIMTCFGVAWGALALYARHVMAQGHVERGSTIGIVAAVLMLITLNPLAAVFTGAGGVLGWMER